MGRGELNSKFRARARAPLKTKWKDAGGVSTARGNKRDTPCKYARRGRERERKIERDDFFLPCVLGNFFFPLLRTSCSQAFYERKVDLEIFD